MSCTARLWKKLICCTRKPTICKCESKGLTSQLISALMFSLHRYYDASSFLPVSSSFFCGSTAWFVSDLVRNPGPSCSKLTTSLVNVSLKFQTLILQIHCYFLLKKCENPLHCKGFSHFFNKNNNVFVTLADICLTNLCLNDIVNLLTML